MNNSQFLAILKKSFITYLQTGARSNKKLGILHGAISEDLKERLNDNIDTYLHTPNKTLVFIVHIQDKTAVAKISNKQDYENYYLHNDFDMAISASKFDFGSTIVYNDYDKFIDKVVHAIKSL